MFSSNRQGTIGDRLEVKDQGPGIEPPERQTDRVCKRCGLALYAHEKERVSHGGGQFSYNYACPGDSR